MSPFWQKLLASLLPFVFKKAEQVVEGTKPTLDAADAEVLGEAAKTVVVETIKKDK